MRTIVNPWAQAADQLEEGITAIDLLQRFLARVPEAGNDFSAASTTRESLLVAAEICHQRAKD